MQPRFKDMNQAGHAMKAMLALTEAVTLVAVDHVSDEVFTQARGQFSESELANLTLAVVAINGWNRFNIAFRDPPPAAKVRS